MSNSDQTKTEPRDESSRGSQRKRDDVTELLEGIRGEFRRELSELRGLISDLLTRNADLLSLVQAALPASMTQLSAASVAMLMTEAPHAKLRLLAPFTSSLGTFPVGEEFNAGDHRIRTHGSRMVLGLAPIMTDAPAKAVADIIHKQTMHLAAEAREQERQRLSAAAAASRARADELDAAAKAS